MKRWFVVILVAAIAVVSSCRRSETPFAGVLSAAVDYTEGEVLIDGKEAEAGQILSEKFTVETGEGSYCAIIFNEKNIMHIDESTHAVIDLGQSVKEVRLDRGIVALALRKVEKIGGGESDGFRLATPTAVAGVRGTVFFVKAESDESSVRVYM